MFGTAPNMRLAPRQVVPIFTMVVNALSEPQTLPRVTGVFAQFAVVPTLLQSHRQGDFLSIRVEFHTNSEETAPRLLAKLQAMVVVQSAEIAEQ